MVRRAEVYDLLSILPLAMITLDSPRIRKHHPMSLWQRLKLVYLLWDNTKMVQTGTSYRSHVAMAAKLLSIPPERPGVVVECGCWKGGTTANLSIICDLVGRDLIVYDSFEGLPEPSPGDRYATAMGTGVFRGTLDEVRGNVARFGRIDRCQFRQGWFADTLPHHEERIVLAYVDVDYQSSMHDCVTNLWPHLVKKGYLFTDEFTRLDYLGIFYSERYWKRYFGRTPPGVMGTGTGVGVGQLFLGPANERSPMERPAGLAYTRKDFSGLWDYYPEDIAPDAPHGQAFER